MRLFRNNAMQRQEENYAVFAKPVAVRGRKIENCIARVLLGVGSNYLTYSTRGIVVAAKQIAWTRPQAFNQSKCEA